MSVNEQAIKKIVDDDFMQFIGSSSGLMWWMKTGKKNIVFLNDKESGGFNSKSIDIGHLLQNLVWAQQVVVEEDFFRFKFFVNAMREGKKATAIFRLRDNRGQRLWWRIVGAPGIANPHYYYGYIQDLTENVSFINYLLEKEITLQSMIESDDYPVLLVDMDTKTIILSNNLVSRLSGYTAHEFSRMKFRDLYPRDQESQAAKIYEICLEKGFWEGKFVIIKKGNLSIDVWVNIKLLSLRNRNVLRISISETITGDTAVLENRIRQLPDRKEFEHSLSNTMAGKQQITDVLDTLLDHQYGEPLFDAVMYADVHTKKGTVYVYGGGDAFKSLTPGTAYDFEGTISQFIFEKHLDYVILEDTLESTKPIDWALFIPYGIRSYYARPFFHGNKLRTLLIFCSNKANRFSEADLELYDVYYPSFLKGLRNWRKAVREKEKSVI